MKLSVFTVMMGPISREEVILKLKNFGYDGVEWRVHPEFHLSPESIEEDLAEARKLCESEGIEICALAPYLSVDHPLVEKILRSAGKHNVPCVRVAVPSYTGNVPYQRLLEETQKNLQRVERMAREAKTKAVIEIHMGNIASSPSLAKKIVEDFDPQYIGVIFDPGNMIVEGLEAWKMGLEILGEHLAHIHVKNTGWFKRNGKWEFEFVPVDEGIADWEFIVKCLKDVGYIGWLSFEDFSSLPLDERLERNIKLFRKYLGNEPV